MSLCEQHFLLAELYELYALWAIQNLNYSVVSEVLLKYSFETS